MAWNILSLELVLFVGALYLYMQLRKSSILSLRPIRGLKVYVPPIDEDFEVLEKSNKGGRENKKGEVNKYDKKKLPAKAKFPLRTLDISETFLKSNQEFFVEYDFFFMLFSVLLGLFAVTQTIKLIVPSLLETNIIFYMMLFLLSMVMVNLTKNTFSLGYFKYSDETKIELLFAIKAMVASFVAFKTLGSTALFDFNLEKAHADTLERFNQVLLLQGGKLNLPVEFTYIVIALFAGALTFSTVRLHIRFSYYFFVLTKNSKALLAEQNPQYKAHIRTMYANMFAPVIVICLYLTPLVETLVVPDFLSVETWKVMRLAFVAGAVCLRMLTFREEI